MEIVIKLDNETKEILKGILKALSPKDEKVEVVENEVVKDEKVEVPTAKIVHDIPKIQKSCAEYARISADNKAKILELIKENNSAKGVSGIPAENLDSFVKSVIELGVSL